MSDDYQHPSSVADIQRQDRELRFQVLDAAAFVEHEFLCVAVFYLGGRSEIKQELVERLIVEWGGIRAAKKIIKTALNLHGKANDETASWLGEVQALAELRNCLAHGITETWQANPPEVRDGRVGREIRTRMRSGGHQVRWIDFQEAEATVAAGRQGAIALSCLVADMTRRVAE